MGAPLSERAHARSLMRELCARSEMPAPLYGFERAVRVKDEAKPLFIDLTRADCFIWENKPLGDQGTNGWLKLAGT